MMNTKREKSVVSLQADAVSYLRHNSIMVENRPTVYTTFSVGNESPKMPERFLGCIAEHPVDIRSYLSLVSHIAQNRETRFRIRVLSSRVTHRILVSRRSLLFFIILHSRVLEYF